MAGDGGDGGTADAEVKTKNHNWVKDDVDNGAGNGGDGGVSWGAGSAD